MGRGSHTHASSGGEEGRVKERNFLLGHNGLFMAACWESDSISVEAASCGVNEGLAREISSSWHSLQSFPVCDPSDAGNIVQCGLRDIELESFTITFQF